MEKELIGYEPFLRLGMIDPRDPTASVNTSDGRKGSTDDGRGKTNPGASQALRRG